MKIDIGPSRAQHKLWGTALAVLCGCALSISALAQSTVQYIHTDALGSPIAITDSAGSLVEQSAFDPYGQSLGQVPMDAPGFTGHVSDSATSLTYMEQRYYDPQIGRFLSVDPVTAYSDPVDAFNRYWYANNNPYRFTDPDGRASKDELKPPPPPVQNMDKITVTATRPSSESGPSFFQLTTFAGLRRDMSVPQAVQAGELTRTVTLPAMIVTASPPAAALAGSATPVVSETAVAVTASAIKSKNLRETVYYTCIAIGVCNGTRPPGQRLDQQKRLQELREGAIRESRQRREQDAFP
ncbi:RHS repeat-associated core domain-containing protein [Stenotrophomonas sp. PS02298]|uniref:RHS repeat domain-containing protein n=1 Tax=Stenotrophomonas sp. PS02298 TaxID=2991424 RepID=UPI00249BB14B|nr:RHS repeat-associated core domain-containing protein [Stenotrophomonas sp. PS02298]